MKIYQGVKMRSKTNGHYYSDIQFIGRDIRVNVRQVKFDQSWLGLTVEKCVMNLKFILAI